MGNESQYLWATAGVSSMGALKYTAHLLSLLYSLLFIINARNKCVTLVQVVIDMEWRSHVIFDSSAAPMFVFSFLRQDKNIIVCLFMSRVQRIYCELMSCLLHAICTIKISSSCQQILAFPRTFFHLFCLFPSFSFHSVFSFFVTFQLPWSLLFHRASLVPFSFSGKSFPLLSQFSFFNGRLFCG